MLVIVEIVVGNYFLSEMVQKNIFFHDSTNLLSIIYYPTTNLTLDILLEICKMFYRYRVLTYIK